MGDRPWQQQLQQPHDQQASCAATAGMIQASATSSSIHGNNIIRKDPGGGYDMAELDHIFLYLNSQDQASSAIQEQPQTLNIFPSQPMHAGEPSPKGSMATNSAQSNALAAAGSSKRPPAAGQPSRLNPADQPSSSGKNGKAAAVVKKEGGGKQHCGATSTAASEHEGPKTPDAKTLRRLAQNREAARKSRLRKKAYIQNLETSRIRLSQLEQELMQRSRTQGAILGGGAFSAGIGGQSPEAAWFDGEYARWVESHERMMAHLRAAVEEQQHGGATASEEQLRQLVDAAVAHHGVLVELKAAVASADVFHLVSGTWLPAAERCFLWIGGFRPSELIKMVARHAEPLTEQQAAGVYGMQQSAREREEALDHDLQATHRALSDTVSSDALLQQLPLCPSGAAYSDIAMAHLSLAIANLTSLEAFVKQADALRLQTLYKLPQILTARQSARCFLAIADHSHRLRALTSLWLSRPRHPDQPTPPPPPAARLHP
ncbi:hypothetical protein E2562_035769 [Oryza meyeriana var. granulata]|uniref:DOG1 domain-containing protein n=1 Tax=Oryza meyeriana var. granulata TaxID=110450 RepID=A0A6G1FG06_9ORYZ|nr:hypothetical protein E2562_035769 [Oryza meyeriana var. granulata]